MSSKKTKYILGVEVDDNDKYKSSVHLAIKLAEMVNNKELSKELSRQALLENYPDKKFAQSLDVFERVVAGEKIPNYIFIKRPGDRVLLDFWKNEKPVAISIILLVGYLLIRSFIA